MGGKAEMEAQRRSHLNEDTRLKHTSSIVEALKIPKSPTSETNLLVLPHVGSLVGFRTGTLREETHLLINLNKCWNPS